MVASHELGKQRKPEVRDVPRMQRLVEHLPEVAGIERAVTPGPQCGMVQWGSRQGGEAGEAVRQAPGGDRLPSLDRAPVVGDQVHRGVRAGPVDHGGEVLDEERQRVVGAARRDVGPTGASDVVRDDVQLAGQTFGQWNPDRARVGEPMDEHDRRAPALTALVHEQGQAGAADPRLSHHGGESTTVPSMRRTFAVGGPRKVGALEANPPATGVVG